MDVRNYIFRHGRVVLEMEGYLMTFGRNGFMVWSPNGYLNSPDETSRCNQTETGKTRTRDICGQMRILPKSIIPWGVGDADGSESEFRELFSTIQG